jgi:hypothetical protein
MANSNVVMINVNSRHDGLRVLDGVDAATETGEINVEDVAMVYKNGALVGKARDRGISDDGVQSDLKGMTLEQFHWVTKTADGLRITDVWETREDFDTFAEEKIGPITQEVGIQGEPETQYFDVYDFLTAG